MTPQSGPAAAAGESVRAAVSLAVAHAVEDARVPRGVTIKVTTLDESTQSGPAGATNRRLHNSAVVAVIGALLPSSFPDLRRVTAARDAAFLSIGAVLSQDVPADTASAPPSRAASGAVPVLRMLADGSVAATWLAKQLSTESGPVAFVHDGSVAGRSLVADLMSGLASITPSTTTTATAMGPVILANGALDPLVLSRLTAGPVGLVIVGGSVDAAARLSVALRAFNPRWAVMTAGQTDGTSCVEFPDRFRDNDVCLAAGTPFAQTTRARAFREDALAAGLALPTPSATAAYDATMLVVDAIASALLGVVSSDVDLRAAVAAKLAAGLTLDGASGRVSFEGTGRRVNPSLTLLRHGRAGWTADRATQ